MNINEQRDNLRKCFTLYLSVAILKTIEKWRFDGEENLYVARRCVYLATVTSALRGRKRYLFRHPARKFKATKRLFAAPVA